MGSIHRSDQIRQCRVVTFFLLLGISIFGGSDAGMRILGDVLRMNYSCSCCSKRLFYDTLFCRLYVFPSFVGGIACWTLTKKLDVWTTREHPWTSMNTREHPWNPDQILGTRQIVFVWYYVVRRVVGGYSVLFFVLLYVYCTPNVSLRRVTTCTRSRYTCWNLERVWVRIAGDRWYRTVPYLIIIFKYGICRMQWWSYAS